MNTPKRKLILSACKISGMTGLVTALILNAAQASIAQSPLLLGGGDVPGNLVLTPSVEHPTVLSIANLGNYDKNATYAGYFDSDKCYEYRDEVISNLESLYTFSGYSNKGYFKPKNFNFKNSKSCGGLWSGHYLNWATTQTIDPFRKALTGGLRVVDTDKRTILEKATRAGSGSYFGERSIDSGLAKDVTPYSNINTDLTTSVRSGNDFQKNKALQTSRTDRVCNTWGSCSNTSKTEHLSVRVEVCVSGLLEDNCKKYGNYYKPEGLLQEYSDSIRYSVFSYLNINGNHIDGGVLRSPQDYIGPAKRAPAIAGTQNNPYKEWDPNTGVLIKNPRGDSIGNSGVINYINKFGELTNQHKSNDPVSELYYAAIRYLRNKGNLSTYSNPATTNTQRDYFPVITSWTDPIQYSCQKNAILGIGDVNTHEDRNLLPGDDNQFMDLNGYTKKIFDLEAINKAATSEFTGRGNSAYIAGLAYYANTQDIRPDIPGTQTASTYWVDVRENQVLLGRKQNQYWLAAKYGGFQVPNNYTFGTPLEESWWTTSGDILSTNDKRPDNFYVASDAENMVKSLRQAFAQIASELQSTTSALAANSSRLETGTAVFQSRLNSRLWNGDLLALSISNNGVVSDTPSWSAADKLDTLNASQLNSRNILSIKGNTGIGYSITTGIDFKWNDLDAEQRSFVSSEDHLKYFRGDRTQERNSTRPDGQFRERGSRLGDIVNSDPQFVHQEDYGYTRLRSWNSQVATKYTTFRNTAEYKARIPMVLVGANDGMLHAFDARLDFGGEELFAFVPNGVLPKLGQLADFDYSHQYYVDGTPRIADAWLGDKWATIAVGTTGAGGNSVFALNITNVTGQDSVTKHNVMWEFSHPKMGYTIGQPAIVALPNQKFGVIVSSGYHDSTNAPEKGYVWILDAANGSILKEFELNTSGNLGGVLAADLNFNAEADRLYVADTAGNVWRIDISGDISSWGIPNTLSNGPVFKVKDNNGNPQAITAPLASAFNQKGEHMILFGTGSYYRPGDNEIPSNPQVESFYGLFDNGYLIDGRSNLLQQRIIAEDLQSGKQLRAVTNNKMTNERGWYLDLAWYQAQGGTGPKGERVLAKASLRSDRVLFTTMLPVEDPCLSGGTSMVMVLDLSSGSRLNYVYFDVNADGLLNESDYKLAPSGDDEGIPWSGISDHGDGVIKGVATMYQWICYAGSSGEVKCLPTGGSMREGRQSWREVRSNDE